jgi:hypothetical protein
MIHELQERIAAKLSGEDAKVIGAEPSPAPTTLPQPTRYRRQPKSSPERLAYAREYVFLGLCFILGICELPHRVRRKNMGTSCRQAQHNVRGCKCSHG